MARTRKKAAWIAAESSYGSDPSSDGSGYVWVPTLSLGEIPMGRELLETNYQTGRPYSTTPILGRQGGTFDMEIPVIGLSSGAADGESTSTDSADDWYDNILESIFSDTPLERTGETTTAASSTTQVVFDAGATDYTEQDLMPVYSSGSFSTRTQWMVITDNASDPTHDVAPNITDPNAAVAYGARQYVWSETSLGGSSQSLVVTDGGGIVGSSFDSDDVGVYMFNGCRPTNYVISAEAGGMYRGALTWGFDSITEETSNKTSLSEPGTAPANTPLTCLLSGVWFNGTEYATKRVEINFGIDAQEIMATSGAQGRSGWDILALNPTITIETEATDAIRELRRSGPTEGRLLVQLGAGVVSGGVLNSCAMHAENALAEAVDRSDDNGRARQVITFRPTDPGEFVAGTLGRFFNFARA